MLKQIKKIVIGNWKMHGCLIRNSELLKKLLNYSKSLNNNILIGVCVPYPYLNQTQTILKNSCIIWGTQDISSYEEGPYTGEVSAKMIKEFESSISIIGHSERRVRYHEQPENIISKAQQAINFEIMPIICIGETIEQRRAGISQKIIYSQLNSILTSLSLEKILKISIAYEPIWAISSHSASIDEIQEMHKFIRIQIVSKLGRDIAYNIPLIYGGGVNSKNAKQILCQEDINGILVGRSSHQSEDFIEICQSAIDAIK